jgi:hypothetical protein
MRMAVDVLACVVMPQRVLGSKPFGSASSEENPAFIARLCLAYLPADFCVSGLAAAKTLV